MPLPILYKAEIAVFLCFFCRFFFFGQNVLNIILWSSSSCCHAVLVAMAFVRACACQLGIGLLCTHQLWFGLLVWGDTSQFDAFLKCDVLGLPSYTHPTGPSSASTSRWTDFPMAARIGQGAKRVKIEDES